MDNEVIKVNDIGLKSELEKLFSKIKDIVLKLQTAKDENRNLKDKIKELEQTLSEIKLEFSNKNSELLNKDKEISELKNKLLDDGTINPVSLLIKYIPFKPIFPSIWISFHELYPYLYRFRRVPYIITSLL